MNRPLNVILGTLWAGLWLVTGCGGTDCEVCGDANCQQCGDESGCGDLSLGDEGGDRDLIDAHSLDMVDDNGIHADLVELPFDAGHDANIGDVPEDATNDFLTGTARVQGHAYRRDMTDHGGIDIFLIRMDRPDLIRASTTTSADGAYEFEGVPADGYFIVASVGEFSRNGPKLSEHFTVFEGSTTGPTDIYLTITGTLAGTLLREGWEKDQSGNLVSIESPSHLVETDAAGRFRMVELLPGEYDVCMLRAGFVASCKSKVVVSAEKVTDMGTVTLLTIDADNPVPGTLRGKIVLVGETDNSGVKVTLGEHAGEPDAITDADGNFTIEGVVSDHVGLTADVPDGTVFDDVYGAQIISLYAGKAENLCPLYIGRGKRVLTQNAWYDPTRIMFTPDSKKLLIHHNAESLLDIRFIDEGYDAWARIKANELIVSPDSSWVAAVSLGFDTDLVTLNLDDFLLDSSRPKTVAYGRIEQVEFTPDSSTLIFSMRPQFPTDYDLVTYAMDVASRNSRPICYGSGFGRIVDSDRVICLGDDGTVDLVDISDGTSVFLELAAGWHRVSADGTKVAVCGSDSKVRVYDVDDGDSVELNPTVQDCLAVLAMPSFEKFVIVDTDGNLIVASTGGAPDVTLDSGNILPLVATPDSSAFVYRKKGETITEYYSRQIGAESSVLLPVQNLGLPSIEHFADRLDRMIRPSINSDAVFTMQRQINSDEPYELHRVALDGTSDVTIGQVYDEMDWEWGIDWEIDEVHGRAYMTGPGRNPVVVDLATGEKTGFDFGGNFGYLAPDRSGTLTHNGDKRGMITWIPFDTLEPVPLNIFDTEYKNTLATQYPPLTPEGDKGMTFSPDSRYIAYAPSTGLADCTLHQYSPDTFVYLYDLKPDAE